MKIIVITPIKNEDWILDEFLTATSLFADHILIADQASEDKSLTIAAKYPKVTVIQNESKEYNEAERQILLIESARKLFPGPKILIALDADEIIAGSSLDSLEWKKIKASNPGTSLQFFKPNLYIRKEQFIEPPNNYCTLGFVDDELTKHSPKQIHSVRVPIKENGETLILKEIVFLHVSYLRPNTQRAKLRYYTVKENILKTDTWFRRRRRYSYREDLLPLTFLSNSPKKWFKYPKPSTINFDKIADNGEEKYDTEILNTLLEKGCLRFWLDDIWNTNWEQLLLKKEIKSTQKLNRPPSLLLYVLSAFDRINNK